MHIVTRKRLIEAKAKYPEAANEIRAWYKIATAARWTNFVELREVFQDADAIDEFVVFNIRHNRYRLVTIVHYARRKGGRMTEGHLYIRSFLNHKQYDNRANWNRGRML